MAFMAWLPATVLLGRKRELPFPARVAWLSPLIGLLLIAGAISHLRTMSKQYQSAGH